MPQCFPTTQLRHTQSKTSNLHTFISNANLDPPLFRNKKKEKKKETYVKVLTYILVIFYTPFYLRMDKCDWINFLHFLHLYLFHVKISTNLLFILNSLDISVHQNSLDILSWWRLENMYDDILIEGREFPCLFFL